MGRASGDVPCRISNAYWPRSCSGPQDPITQRLYYRWNFQLMAASGYIVVVTKRRGLPSFERARNNAVSGNWDGQPMRDYLTALDKISVEPLC